MSNYLRNPEIKAFILKILLVHIIFAGAILLFVGNAISSINKNIITQNTTLVGQLLDKHPELEDDIMRSLDQTPTQEEIDKGRNVLQSYGYDDNISIANQPLLKAWAPNFQLNILFMVLAYLIFLLVLVFFEYKKIYDKAKILSLASENVMEGNYKAIKPDNDEGDFAILTYNFNNMSSRLELSLESLKKDKLFLKNIISDISHQLKTPLSSLSAINDILLEDKNVSPEISKDFLQKSRSQLDRMEWLIINLLKMARLEAGAIKFKSENFSVLNSINSAVSSLTFKAKEKKVNINIIGDKSICLCGDEGWISEAFSNILKNSIEHTAIAGFITIHIMETSIFTNVVIEDTGEGIDKNELPHIFERFYKGVNTVKAESVGIGLALCKLIIEEQNGNISVESEKTKGSKFTITFLKGVF